MKANGRAWTSRLLWVVLLAAATAASADSVRRSRLAHADPHPPGHGPSRPFHPYWFRNTQVPPDSGLMDSRIAEIADAYGWGDFAEARRLAEALLQETDGQDLLNQAVTFIILSHAAEGDADAAREAAGRLASVAPAACKEVLAYVNGDALARDARVAALQQGGGSALAPETRLRLAQTHDIAGDLDRAAQLYTDLIEDYPDHRAAGAAVSQLVIIRLQTEGPDLAREEALAAIEQHPDSPPILRAAVRGYAWTYLTEADTFGALCELRELGDASSNRLLRHEVGAAAVQVVWAHLGGYPPTHAHQDSGQLSHALTFTSWALTQMHPSYDRTDTLLCLGWFLQWSGNDSEAFPHLMRYVVDPYIPPYTAVKAWRDLQGSLPRARSLDLEDLTWVAIADERMKQSGWQDYSPKHAAPWFDPLSTGEWSTLAESIAALSRGEASDSPWAPLAAAHAYLEAQAPDRAMACLQTVIDRWPVRREAQVAAVELAELLTEEGRFSEAIAICRELLSSDLPPDIESAAHREIARARLCRGDGEEALAHYHEVIAGGPSSREAEEAVRTIVEVTTSCLGLDAAVAVMRRIAEQHPRTTVADRARFAIGETYVAEDRPELADEEWASLVSDRPNSRVAHQARTRLAELRYALGTRAFMDGHYAEALPWLERLMPGLDRVVMETTAGQPTGEGSSLSAMEDRQVMFWLGESCQKLERWEEAAEIFELLAVPGNPAEEFALLQLGRSKMEAGYHADALEAFAKLKDRFPESAFIAQCESYLRTIQGER